MEFSKKLGPISLHWEAGYNYVHTGNDGWLAGVIVDHDLTENLEVDAEFYALGTFHPSAGQQTIEGGMRYKIHPPFILLLMAGRSVLLRALQRSYSVVPGRWRSIDISVRNDGRFHTPRRRRKIFSEKSCGLGV
jgi:hypothetical protein